MRKNLLAAVTMMSLAGTIPAHAVETRISGFLTASVNMLDTDEAEYFEINDYPNFARDSIFGLQFDTRIDKQLSLTTQVVAKDNGGGFDTEVSWAYATYMANSNNRIRVGRLAISDFHYSDFVNVSYAYPWIRPPVEVYGNVPITSYDGVEWAYFRALGDWDFEFSLRAGGFDQDVVLGGNEIHIKSKTYWALASKFFYEDLTIRLAYAQPRISMESDKMDEDFFDLMPAGTVRKLRNDDITIDFYDIAIHYDTLTWLAYAEGGVTKRNRSPLPEQSSFYLGGGYHFGNWLPTLTYAVRNSQTRTDLIGEVPFPRVANPDGYDGILAGANSFVNSFDEDQESIILGLRWDFHTSAALKFELQHIKPKNDKNSGLIESVAGEGYDNEAINMIGTSISVAF